MNKDEEYRLNPQSVLRSKAVASSVLSTHYFFILFLNLLFNSQVTHAIFVESIYSLLVSSLGSTNIAFGGKPDLEKVVLKTPIHLAVHPMFHFLVDQLNVVSLLLMVAR